MFDPAGDLCLGRVAELELVEDIASEPAVAVRIPQAVERAEWIVRARSGQFLMRPLDADRGCQGSEAQVERGELDFHPAFLLLVGEGLANAVAGRIGRVGKAEFIVLVVGRADPEPDGVDRRRIGAIFAFCREFGLMRVDPGAELFALSTRNVIQAVVLCHRRADEPAVEQVRTAD